MAALRWLLAATIAVGVFSCEGCNRRPKTYNVGGTVTYHGKPVEGASVLFTPTEGRPASAVTDAKGHFQLRSYSEGDGALAGEQTVSIAKNVVDPRGGLNAGEIRVTSPLPLKYASPVTSPLKATVKTDGANDFQFDLTD